MAIDGVDPWASVEKSAALAPGWQGRSSRENSFFSSYTLGGGGWSYRMGDFALKSLPPSWDSINMTVVPINATDPETIVVPFISRNATAPFVDGQDLWTSNCRANYFTNGADFFPGETQSVDESPPMPVLTDPSPRKFAPPIPPQDRNYPISSLIDLTAFMDVVLPPNIQPPTPASGNGTAHFYVQGKVGILALGSFSTGASFDQWFRILAKGFDALKEAGTTHLIVDVVSTVNALLACPFY